MIFNDLFSNVSTASTIIFIASVGVFGILAGKVKMLGFKLGIAGVLFMGLLVGHFGAQIDHHVLHFIKEFGLILFVYSIGIEIGPRFVSSFRDNGILLNGLAITIILLGVAIAFGIKYIFKLDTQVIAGLMCGAVTNTPSLGAVQSVITEQFQGGAELAKVSGMAYAVAYPFGIIGIILAMFVIKAIFKISVEKEQKNLAKESKSRSSKAIPVNIDVTNPNLFGKSLHYVKSSLDKEFVFSRILRGSDYIIPEDKTIIERGDVFVGLCSKKNIPQLELKIGRVYPSGKYEISGDLSMRHILITNRKVAGKKLKHINLSGLFPANITRIFRGDTEIIPTANNFIEFGDTVRVVGERSKMDEVANFLGNSQRDLSSPNLIPLFIGMLLGILLGSIPVFIPGLPAPAKLGLAGGPLIISLLLGHKGRIGKFDFYMTPSANRFIREMGIVLFLACVGIGAGGNFFETIVNGGYMWMLYAAIITFVPLFIVGIIGRLLKVNYLTLCGVLAGSMTDPPALEFASSIAPVQAQARAYATVYPVTMFLRILMAQLLVLLLT